MRHQRYFEYEINKSVDFNQKQEFIADTRKFMMEHKMLPMNDKTFVSRNRMSECDTAYICYLFAKQHPEIVNNLEKFKWSVPFQKQESNYLSVLNEYILNNQQLNKINKSKSRSR